MDQRAREVARHWTLAQPAISAYVASLVHEFRDRDDVLQEVAVAVLDSFDTYDPGRPFIGWAIGVARNQVLLHLRRRSRDRLVLSEAALARLETAFVDVRPEEIRRLDDLADCVAALDARSRRLCELRYREDRKPAEIGRLLGQPANTVAKSLQRVREALRDCVARRAALEGA